ncbi:DUF413 domain-containing protein [Algoriphagus machipongonensis]|uniref:Macrodomain Ori protein n=1 Tax=Algoriphagus machipongonensis TaxID=388413 RepID=A3HT88_9BACT|nr:DUF413 domain-containing protein [Algoriphagus machipongonensis]EAZ83056.1 hypothetical protein ALPR1_12585 [Algoriphagus machipongonensis]
MKEITRHQNLIKRKGTFIVDCSHAIFSEEELDTLKKYGHWFMALTSGELNPISELQGEFIKVAKREKNPTSPFEWAWFKYLGRKRIEEEHGDRLKIQYTPKEDSFYSREMAKQQKRMIFSVVSKNHKE